MSTKYFAIDWLFWWRSHRCFGDRNEQILHFTIKQLRRKGGRAAIFSLQKLDSVTSEFSNPLITRAISSSFKILFHSFYSLSFLLRFILFTSFLVCFVYLSFSLPVDLYLHHHQHQQQLNHSKLQTWNLSTYRYTIFTYSHKISYIYLKNYIYYDFFESFVFACA